MGRSNEQPTNRLARADNPSNIEPFKVMRNRYYLCLIISKRELRFYYFQHSDEYRVKYDMGLAFAGVRIHGHREA